MAQVPEQGTVAGHVVDKATGDAIIEAGVEAIPGGKRARTDVDGKYSLKLAPGTYELRVFAPLYKGSRLQNVVVKTNEVTVADTVLQPEGEAGIEVREVVAQASKAAEATQMLQRKKSAVVSDNIAAETITKSPDRNAAEVVKRVPAVTIQNDKFVVVRGLGERYSSALLNGSRLPSTDPSKRVVPLDLFPADFIEALNILKGYTPDLPGDFSGGLVDIRLKEFPDTLTYSLGVSTGANTNSTFQSFDTYKGSGVDYFGFGKGYRSLSDNVPDNLKDRGKNVPAAQQRGYASELKNIWSVDSKTAPPNFGVNASIGNSFGPLGAALGVVYSTEYKRRTNEFQETFSSDMAGGQVNLRELPDRLAFDRSTFTTRLGAVLSSGYKLSNEHKLSLRALIDRNSADEVINGVGFDRTIGLDHQVAQSRLQYKEEQLGYGQLAGEHHWDGINVDWRTALSQTTEDEPDTRLISYVLDPAPGLTRQLCAAGEGCPESATRLFSNLDEYLSDSAVDFTIPLKTALPFTDVWSGLPAKIKFGPAYAYRHRSFELRRFLYNRLSNQSGLDLAASPEVQLAPENIGTNFEFIEGSRKSDSFSASQEIAAFYAMADLPIVPDRLRFVGGVRAEYSYIATDGFNLGIEYPIHARINDLKPLVGLNLIYSPTDDMNVRYGFSRTVSRPEFRELTPTRFVVPNGERPVVGNPDLTSSDIESHDLRWEWFLAPTEILSVGVFYKELSQPIEQIVETESSGERDSFRNAADGKLIGLELEGRKNLAALSDMAAPFTLLANVAYVHSKVNIPKGKFDAQTSTSRALQGQADYVANAGLEYVNPLLGTGRLLYNGIGTRIAAGGANHLPDIIEAPRNTLDFVWLAKIVPFAVPLQAKFAVENMLNEPYIQTQADHLSHRYRTGVKFTVGLSYTY